MRVAVSATGNDLDAPFSPVFGRCPIYVIVDTTTMAFQAAPNQAMGASGGAGIQAAQDVIGQGVGAVITGNVGPNAYRVLASAGVPIYTFAGGTVRQAVEAFRAGRLSAVGDATAPAHAGMGMMRGAGMGRGMGGRGMGAGGQGVRGFGGPMPSPQTPAQPAPPPTEPSPQQDLDGLRDEVRTLQARLHEVTARIDELNRG